MNANNLSVQPLLLANMVYAAPLVRSANGTWHCNGKILVSYIADKLDYLVCEEVLVPVSFEEGSAAYDHFIVVEGNVLFRQFVQDKLDAHGSEWFMDTDSRRIVDLFRHYETMRG